MFATTTDDTVGLLQVNGKVGALSTSATAPAFYALGDTNTGMYFSAADTIDFTSGGTARATIAAAGLTVVAGFGCNTKAPQTAYASGGALAAYGAGANGFDTGANASALHAMVVSLRAALVANGIMS